MRLRADKHLSHLAVETERVNAICKSFISVGNAAFSGASSMITSLSSSRFCLATVRLANGVREQVGLSCTKKLGVQDE